MNKSVLLIASELLKMADNEFSNHGCNDYEIEDTPENRNIVFDAYQLAFGENIELSAKDGKLLVMDNVMMSYCAQALSAEAMNQ